MDDDINCVVRYCQVPPQILAVREVSRSESKWRIRLRNVSRYVLIPDTAMGAHRLEVGEQLLVERVGRQRGAVADN